MKITMLCVGKLSLAFIREGAAEYSRRIQRYTSLSTIELKEETPKGKVRDIEKIRTLESKRLLEKIPANAYTVVLDEKGKHISSEEFAASIEQGALHGINDWCFIVGGAYGTSKDLQQRADLVLSLSSMTWTHQMARMLMLEQIYRGFTIMRGEPYHNH